MSISFDENKSLCFNISPDDICKCADEPYESDFVRDENNKLHMCIGTNCIIDKLLNELKHIGGAKNKKIDKRDFKKEASNNKLLIRYNKAREIAEYVLNYIRTSKRVLTEMELKELIRSYSNEKAIFLDDSILYEIIAYIKQTGKDTIHPFFAVKKEDIYNFKCLMQNLSNIIDVSDYKYKVYSGVKLLREFEDITSLPDNDRYLNINENYMMPPIILALFGTKIPMLYDLAIAQDLFYLHLEFDTERYETQNNSLLFLYRLADKQPYITPSGHGNVSHSYSEMLRITLSIIMKLIIIDIMQGTLYSKLVHKVLRFIDEFRNIKKYNTLEELVTDAILRIWSLYPTIISNPTTNETESVTYVEYVIDNNSNLLIAKQEMNKNNAVLANILNTCSVNNAYRNNPILNNIFNQNFLTNHIKTPIVNNTGFIVISVPRINNYNFFTNRDRLQTVLKDINTSYIDIDTNLIINNNTYSLRSAVCYKQADCSNYSATICILKTKVGWILYDSDMLLGPNNKDELINKLIELYKNELQLTDEAARQKATDELRENRLNIGALYIDEATALNIIRQFCTLLVYAEDYSTFVNRNSLLCRPVD